MHYIGVDIGGTFTDCVLVDSGGRHLTAKALSTKDDPVQGVVAALTQLAGDADTSLADLVAETGRFSHGTTIGTNAVLERKGARVGLITTAGHGEALALMRGRGRVAGLPIEQVFQVHGTALPAPLIVPGAVLELHERVDRKGNVVVALNQETARAEIAAFIERFELDAVAVSLLWSFVNPDHERTIGDLVGAVAPQVHVSLSVDVSPRLGEYERAVATVINGYVGPACSRYLGRLESSLAESGLATPLLVMQSNGGVAPVATASKTSLGTIDSGPAGGLTGVAAVARTYGHSHVVATDMGGTSFDIGLVIDSMPAMAEENVIDQYTYRLPHLDVKTVACGGGTIAWRDEKTSSMRVGPASAGSEPGPASYGRGGTQPTVTDADVVLGLIRPKSFLDGQMPLDAEAARGAVASLSEELGLSVEETAAGILEINNMHAATMIRQQTIEQGEDPRDFVLYAYGGAGPVHAFGFAAEAGMREVVIPIGNGASTLSAYGIASSDVVRFVEQETNVSAPFDDDHVADVIRAAEDTARAAVQETGVDGEVSVTTVALMRFAEQLTNSLDVALPEPGPGFGQRLTEAFLAEYERRYGAGGSGLFGSPELAALRARASIDSGVPAVGGSADSAGADPKIETAEVYWPHEKSWSTTVVYDAAAIAAHGTITGPALVELAHTTVAVPRNATLTLGSHSELRLTLPETSVSKTQEVVR